MATDKKTESKDTTSPAEKAASAKITKNVRKPSSKGQSKEELAKKKTAFNEMRATWFDRYMKDTLPDMYELHISPDRNVLLSNDQALHLAEFIQAGIAAKCLDNMIGEMLGEKEPTHLQKTVIGDRDQIVEMLEKLGHTPKMYKTPAKRKKLRKLISKAENARNVFAEKNLGLVTMIAGRLKKSNITAGTVDFDDLVAEGMNGLMSAIDHYNPAMGFKFSTSAAWWIEQPIRGYLDSKTKTIHMPTHMNNIYKAIHYATRALRDMHPEFPDDSHITVEMLAEYCQGRGYDKMTPEKIEEAMMYRRETISYDNPFGENNPNDKTLSELIESDEDIAGDILNRIGGKDNFNRMLALVDDDKKREILRDWYTSRDMHEIVILSNVSRKHCLTKERVRQLKSEAESELQDKIRTMAAEKGVGVSDAIMVDDREEDFLELM